jgi:hypothetical protein
MLKTGDSRRDVPLFSLTMAVFAKNPKDRAPHCVGNARKIKSPGHPARMFIDFRLGLRLHDRNSR